MKKTASLLLLVVLMVTAIPQGGAQEASSHETSSAERVVPMGIKIVLVGFDPSTLDLDYIRWGENIPSKRVNAVLTNDNSTRVVYNFSYAFIFTDESFRTKTVNFLNGIAELRTEYNPWFERELPNIIYDARRTEDWLISQNQTYGGFPAHGYTFVLANLTTVPSITYTQINSPRTDPPTPHYYANTWVDMDRQYKIRYRDFAVAWGGKSRLWYLDFAAGPEYWTWNNPEPLAHVPLQVAMEMYEINIHTPGGKRWLTQLISDYVTEMVWTFAAPQFVYYPQFSERYRIVVHLFDNRSAEDRVGVDITSTIQKQPILDAFKPLLRYSTVDVEVNTHVLDREPDSPIRKLIIDSTFTPPSDLRLTPYVDVRPVYRFLRGDMTQWIGRSPLGVKVLPVFAFAFPSGYSLGYTFRWLVSREPDTIANFYGISLGDVSFIGMTQDDFLRGDYFSVNQQGKGIGFTQFVIHEVGHSLGLMHPNTYTFLGDFVSSAMSYYSWEYAFSQFDKDALNRAHADQLSLMATSYLGEAKALAATKMVWPNALRNMEFADRLLRNADSLYYKMNYAEAVKLASRALGEAKQAVSALLGAPAVSGLLFVSSILTGFLIGTLVMFVALRRSWRSASMIATHQIWH